MSALNLTVSQRKFTKLNARLDNDTLVLDGEYTFTVNNEGLAPTGSITVNIDEVLIGNRETRIISNKTKSIGMVRSRSSTEVSIPFSLQSESSAALNTIRSACNENSISLSTKATMTGLLFKAEASSKGVYPVSSTDCDLSSPEPDRPDQPPIEQPVEPVEPVEPPARTPGDGNSEDGGSNNDGEDNNENGQENESTISGPNIASINETETYTWSDFTNATANIEWALLSEREDPNPENTELVLADENIRDTVELEFTAYVSGDFLIVIQSYDTQGQLLTEGQKVVTVVPPEN